MIGRAAIGIRGFLTKSNIISILENRQNLPLLIESRAITYGQWNGKENALGIVETHYTNYFKGIHSFKPYKLN
jgi:hypothetical protein